MDSDLKSAVGKDINFRAVGEAPYLPAASWPEGGVSGFVKEHEIQYELEKFFNEFFISTRYKVESLVKKPNPHLYIKEPVVNDIFRALDTVQEKDQRDLVLQKLKSLQDKIKTAQKTPKENGTIGFEPFLDPGYLIQELRAVYLEMHLHTDQVSLVNLVKNVGHKEEKQ